MGGERRGTLVKVGSGDRAGDSGRIRKLFQEELTFQLSLEAEIVK